MPELPEVEDAARRLRPVIVGRTLRRLSVLHPAYRRRLPRSRAKHAEGLRIVRLDRLGKHQVIRLEGDISILVHFRMTGDWEVVAPGSGMPEHARAILTLDTGTRVTLTDPRALGSLTVHRGDVPLPQMGLEPLDDAFNGTALLAALGSRRISIKQALLDQSVVAGVGNIYAAEALWRAKIDPQVSARDIGTAAANRLATALRRTLVTASRTPARYQQSSNLRFKVYDREGRPCARCRSPIARIIQGARSTYYCPSCQATK